MDAACHSRINIAVEAERSEGVGPTMVVVELTD